MLYIIHCLLHLENEVSKKGSLDACSAFPFENYMHQLKRLVRSVRMPMVQIIQRLSKKNREIELSLKGNTSVSTTSPNNAYVLADQSCCEVVSAEEKDSCRIPARWSSLQWTMWFADSRCLQSPQEKCMHESDSFWIPEYLLNTWIPNLAIKTEDDDTGQSMFMGLLHDLWID